VVILQGSGTVSWDGDVSSPLIGAGYKGAPAKLSDQIASALAGAGIASLRFSKRGVDEPSEIVNQTLPNIVRDAGAAIELARRRFPGLKLGVVGLSEGALVAVIAAPEHPVDALFLLSLPTRSIEELLNYQFLEWPVEVIRRADTNRDGILSAGELSVESGNGGLTFPLLGSGFAALPWRELDSTHGGSLSIVDEVIPAYRRLMGAVRSLLASPGLAPWYQSMLAQTPFAELAAKITAPVYLYQGLEDAQVRWSWAERDRQQFRDLRAFRLYAGVGHCFAPMDGVVGEIKTSGPLGADVLGALAHDALGGLSAR